MANWYCNSVAYAAVPVWQASFAYTVGLFVRQVAPTEANARVFRCTTAGTSAASEPSWNTGKGTTTASGGATFTEVTGSSTYNVPPTWSAPHKRIDNALGHCLAGDSVLVSSVHNYSVAASYQINSGINALFNNWIKCVCVADATGAVSTGAVEAASNANLSITQRWTWFEGITFQCGTGSSSTVTLTIGATNDGSHVFKNVGFEISSTGASSVIAIGNTSVLQRLYWQTVRVKFGATGQKINIGSSTLYWKNGSVDAAGSVPAQLFNFNGQQTSVVIDGVDISSIGSGNTIFGGTTTAECFGQLVNCKADPAATLGQQKTSPGQFSCDSVSSSLSANVSYQARINAFGALSTETTLIRAGGASDGVTAFSWKVVTTANATSVTPFDCFQGSLWNDAVGSSKTLTVNIMNDGVTLKDNEVWLEVEYPGSASHPMTSFATSAPNILAAGSNLSSGSFGWVTTGIASPVQQKASVSFTPLLAGEVRYTVRVARASKTLYADPATGLT